MCEKKSPRRLGHKGGTSRTDVRFVYNQSIWVWWGVRSQSKVILMIFLWPLMTNRLMNASLTHLAPHPEVLFERAAARRNALDLNYAGALTPPEAWALAQAGAALIVDVRTAAEVKFVGRVPGALHVQWPGLPQSAAFIEALNPVVEREQAVLLLCRSAVRSHKAATVAAAAGYTAAYNVLEGFEGDLDEHQQRGHFNGWRWHGLPWVQD